MVLNPAVAACTSFDVIGMARRTSRTKSASTENQFPFLLSLFITDVLSISITPHERASNFPPGAAHSTPNV